MHLLFFTCLSSTQMVELGCFKTTCIRLFPSLKGAIIAVFLHCGGYVTPSSAVALGGRPESGNKP